MAQSQLAAGKKSPRQYERKLSQVKPAVLATAYSQKRAGKGNNPTSPEKRKPGEVRVLDEQLPKDIEGGKES